MVTDTPISHSPAREAEVDSGRVVWNNLGLTTLAILEQDDLSNNHLSRFENTHLNACVQIPWGKSNRSDKSNELVGQESRTTECCCSALLEEEILVAASWNSVMYSESMPAVMVTFQPSPTGVAVTRYSISSCLLQRYGPLIHASRF